MKRMLLIGGLLTPLMFSFQAAASTGVLVLAHGSMQAGMKSCSLQTPTPMESFILDAINNINKTNEDLAGPNPVSRIELAFGMWSTMCIDMAIERLSKSFANEGKTLTEVDLFPLFISSHSAVIEMQKYIFGLRKDKVIPIPMVRPTKYLGQIKFNFHSSLDYDARVSLILANRAHDLIHQAHQAGYREHDKMDLVLVMHGPVSDADNEKWMKMGRDYIKDVNYLFPLGKLTVISLRDDASQEVQDEATRQLRKSVETSSKNGQISLVQPLLLSFGGIESGIRDRLQGLKYIGLGKPLLPDSQLEKLLLDRIKF